MASQIGYTFDNALDKLAGNWPRESVLGGDWLVIIQCGLGVAVCALIWALFLRRKKRRRHARRPTHASAELAGSARTVSATSNTGQGADDAHGEHRRRRRRRGRRKNPTLAETGGLPPVRADGHGRNLV
jgi:hypothetical protein